MFSMAFMTGNQPIYHYPSLDFEQVLWSAGYTQIAGIDEAGRGAIAGPVVAAATILPVSHSIGQTLRSVRDSKQMTPCARQKWAELIKEAAVAWGVGFASPEEIDSLGILPATKLAAKRAMEDLLPDYLITDFLLFPEIDLPQTALVKGDQRSLSVSSASVIAKTTRDAFMIEMADQFPGYGFAQHKGYGTFLHQKAILKLNRCKIHRMSFSFPK
jgi:ribonuclease HII